MSRRTIITTSEKATQKSITRPRSSVHHTSFLWALCHEFVRSTTHRKPALNAAGLPFLRRSHRPTNEPPVHSEWWPSRRRSPDARSLDPATGDLPEILHQPEFDPLITPATQRALRARLVGDPFVSAAEHQDLDQLPEDHLLGDARAVTSERMVRLSLGQEGTKLLSDGLLLMYGGTAGTMHTPPVREA